MPKNSNMRHGHPIARWNAAKTELTEILTAYAQTGSAQPSYGEVAAKMKEIPFAGDEPAFHQMLDEISEQENEGGFGLLAAIVVSKETGRPDQDFFDLAEHLGRLVAGNDAAARERFWISEVNLVRKSSTPQRSRRSINFR